MSDLLYFEDLEEGDSWRSRGRTITEADIANFAGLTGDYDPLHVDHEFAKKTPFGRPIAHGLLGLSYLAGLSSCAPAVRTDAFVSLDEWTFHKPIFVGDTIYAVTQLVEKHEQGRRRGRVVWRRKLLNQRDETVQSGRLTTLVRRSAPGTESRAA